MPDHHRPAVRPRRLSLLAATGLLALALSACSDDDGADADDGTSPEDVLAEAKRVLDETSGVEVSLTTTDLPSGETGITEATGVGVHPPAFQGDFSLSVSGLPGTAEVVAVDGTTWAKGSLLFPDWTEIDPGEYGAPDPNELMSEDRGFSALLSATTDVEKGDSVRGGAGNEEIFTEYTGALPAESVTNIIPAAEGDFDVTYTISDDDELRKAVITGAFYGSDTMTYTLTFDAYGTEQEITAP